MSRALFEPSLEQQVAQTQRAVAHLERRPGTSPPGEPKWWYIESTSTPVSIAAAGNHIPTWQTTAETNDTDEVFMTVDPTGLGLAMTGEDQPDHLGGTQELRDLVSSFFVSCTARIGLTNVILMPDSTVGAGVAPGGTINVVFTQEPGGPLTPWNRGEAQSLTHSWQMAERGHVNNLGIWQGGEAVVAAPGVVGEYFTCRVTNGDTVARTLEHVKMVVVRLEPGHYNLDHDHSQGLVPQGEQPWSD